jgi:HAD superfamily hydrolase (TIGR01509 family)
MSMASVTARAAHVADLESAACRWQLSLDASDSALSTAGPSLPAAEVSTRRRTLIEERQETARFITRVAKETGVRPVPWISSMRVTPKMLGLEPTSVACLFDLDGVLTDSAVFHATAWREVFDDFLGAVGERMDRRVMPFTVDDYRAYMEGRPRLEGVKTFLNSRGISLPEGNGDDPATTDTVHGLARRKAEALHRGLGRRGVSALPNARRYLESAGRAGLDRAVVSASTSTLAMLENASLARLLEARVDADVIHSDRLRSRPAPDTLLSACAQLDAQPHDTAMLTHSGTGVAAGRAAGMTVIGVGGDGLDAAGARGGRRRRARTCRARLLRPAGARKRRVPS